MPVKRDQFKFCYSFEVIERATGDRLHCRWWVNWRDPIFNEGRARSADDFETGKVLRRTESEPDLAFNYSKLTGAGGIDGDDGDAFVPNGNIKGVEGKSSGGAPTKARASTTTTRKKTTSAVSRGSRVASGAAPRTQTAKNSAKSRNVYVTTLI